MSLTLRETAAIAAMQSLITINDDDDRDGNYHNKEWYTKMAVELADCLIAELERTKPPPPAAEIPNHNCQDHRIETYFGSFDGKPNRAPDIINCNYCGKKL